MDYPDFYQGCEERLSYQGCDVKSKESLNLDAVKIQEKSWNNNLNNLYDDCVSDDENLGPIHIVAQQMIHIAMTACTVGEKIGLNNKRRFCYKNIQHICSKTKEHLKKSDMVVANAKSQGIPWVVKNFIFSFLRMLDGWKCLKMILLEKYVNYNRIESRYYSPHIRETFYEWQAISKDMLFEIYKIFVSLNQKFQIEQSKMEQNAKMYPSISTNKGWIAKSESNKQKKIIINRDHLKSHTLDGTLVPLNFQTSGAVFDNQELKLAKKSINNLCSDAKYDNFLNDPYVQGAMLKHKSSSSTSISKEIDSDWEIAKRAACNLVDSFTKVKNGDESDKRSEPVAIDKTKRALGQLLDSETFLMILQKCHLTENSALETVKQKIINQTYKNHGKLLEEVDEIFQVLLGDIQAEHQHEMISEICIVWEKFKRTLMDVS